MDPQLRAAAQALSRGDPLRALKYVALRQDAQALALRATALAQLGEYKEAKELFKRACKGFSQSEAVARARCVVALAEVALASRELTAADAGLDRAIDVLQRHNDLANARYAQLLHARYALSLGNVALAQARLEAIDALLTRGSARLDVGSVAPALRSVLELTRAEVALRRAEPQKARTALVRAEKAAARANIPALSAEVAGAKRALEQPVARLATANGSELLSLDQVALLLAKGSFVVDASRRTVQQGASRVSFEIRPVLFALACRLAEASPNEVSREELIRVGFGMQRQSDSLRARLRVAMGRLRKQLAPLADLEAKRLGFALRPHSPPAYVLLPPASDDATSLLALVSDGEAWATSALALALGWSQRSVQRALSTLEENRRVQSLGRGKNRRWLASPLHGFATHLLLPVSSHGP